MVRGAAGRGETREFLEVLEVEPTVELADGVHRCGGGVVLVDLSDDFLDEILEGDDPIGSAVLVHHDGNVVARGSSESA